MHTAWAGAAVLLVVIGLWLVVAAGLQRGLLPLVPLPEGPRDRQRHHHGRREPTDAAAGR